MADALRRLVTAYWVRCAAVSLAAGLLVASLLSALGGAPLGIVLPRALVHAAVMGTLVGSILPRVAHGLRDAGAARGWSAVVLTLVVLGAAGTGLACAVLELGAGGAPGALGACFAAAVQVNVILSLMLGIGMTFYEMQRGRADRLELELRKSALEARLSSLEARLHPHFLFNTLNAITELIHENPERAERTVERLAALLRASLDATERGLVPLARELELVADYLEIEKARLGERLAYTIDVAPALAGWPVPPLAVQTLVENSITHAIAPRPGGGRVRVDGSAADGRLVVDVWDDGPGFAAGAMRSGHALDNLKARLATRFGPAASLAVARADGGTRVTLVIPRSPA
jgi:LytS/YehU family sensor histidine kinase